MRQRMIFSRGAEIKIARQTWIDETLEKAIVKDLMELLPLLGIMAHEILARMPCPNCRRWPGKPPKRGISDIVGLIPPRLFRGEEPLWARPLYIEVKKPKGGVEGIEQADILERVRREGGVGFFCRGRDNCCEQLHAAGVKIPNTIWEPKEKALASLSQINPGKRGGGNNGAEPLNLPKPSRPS